VSIFVLIVTLIYWAISRPPDSRPLAGHLYGRSILTTFALISLRLVQPPTGRHACRHSWSSSSSFLSDGPGSYLLRTSPSASGPGRLRPACAHVRSVLRDDGRGGLLAANERRVRSILPVVVSSFTLMVLVLAASSYHLGSICRGPATAIWFVGFESQVGDHRAVDEQHVGVAAADASADGCLRTPTRRGRCRRSRSGSRGTGSPVQRRA